jgi:endoplasmic reticulum chaperone BiP
MRNTIEDKEKLADKIESDDKDKIKEALQEAQDWLKEHEDAEREDFESHLKDLQSVCDPIIAQVYKQHGGPTGGASDEEDHEDL